MNAKLGLNSFNSFAKSGLKGGPKNKSIKNTIAKSSQANNDNPDAPAEGGDSPETTGDLKQKDTSVSGGEYATAGEKTNEPTSIFLNEEEAEKFRQQLERQNLINQYDLMSGYRQAEYAGQDQDRLLQNQYIAGLQNQQRAALGAQIATTLGNAGIGALKDIAGAAQSIRDKKGSGSDSEECQSCNTKHGKDTHALTQKQGKAFEGVEGTIPVDAKGNPILLDEHGQPIQAQTHTLAQNSTTTEGNQTQQESIDGQIYTDRQDHDAAAYGEEAFEIAAIEPEHHEVEAPEDDDEVEEAVS